jgi:hypothetical protein
MQASGDTPTELAENIQAVAEVTDFYARDRLTGFLSTANLSNTVGVINVGLSIPQGEQWLVYAASAYALQTAATTSRFQAMLSIAAGGNAVYVPVGQPSSLAATEAAYTGGFLNNPMIMRPGDLLLVQVQAYTGAANTGYYGMLLYSRMLGS